MLERYLLDTYNWCGTCLLLAGLHLQNIPIMMLWYPTECKELKLHDSSLVEHKFSSSCCSIHRIKTLCDATCNSIHSVCDGIFSSVLLCCLLLALGQTMPYIFLPLKALNIGFTQWQAALLLSIIGFAEIFGKLLLGAIGDLKQVNIVLLFGSVILAGGLSSLLMGICWHYATLAFLGGVYGLMLGKLNINIAYSTVNVVP